MQWALSLLILAVSASALAADYGPKLDAQFRLYEQAKQTMIERVGRAGGAISRAEWEAMLATPDWTADDSASLRADQARRIALAKEKARAASAIDLDAIRGDAAKVATFCADFPKGAMLHVHPTGTMARATVEKLLASANPVSGFQKVTHLAFMNDGAIEAGGTDFLKPYPETTHYAELGAADQQRFEALFFFPPGPHPFSRFTPIFLLNSLLGVKTPAAQATFYDDFLARARREHLHYVEFTQDFKAADLTPDFLPRLEAQVAAWKQAYGLEVRFNFAFLRFKTSDENRELMRKVLALPASPALVGVDLVSDETHAPALESAQGAYATLAASASKLHRTMHAGEVGDSRDPRDAMLLGAERIGHGVQLAGDPVALEYAARHALPVEINLTSNYRLEAIDTIAHHPFLDYLRLGLRPSLSTDDEGILETDIDAECVAAITQTDIRYSELRQLAINSVTPSFAPESLREKLGAQLFAELDAFEKNAKAPAQPEAEPGP